MSTEPERPPQLDPALVNEFVSKAHGDLDEVKLAIESLRALEPVLREGGIDEAVVRDLEQARANLQLAYAKAVSDASGETEPTDA